MTTGLTPRTASLPAFFAWVIRSPWGWFLLALVPRLLYLLEQEAFSPLFYQPLLDEQELVESARALLRGEGFGPEPLFKAPLYPVLLAGVMAATGEAWWFVARLLQHAAGAGVAALGFVAASKLAGPGRRGRAAGAVAAALLAFNAPAIRLENQLLLDHLVFALQSAMLLALLCAAASPRWRLARRWAAGAGAFAALAWLTRPTLTPVLPFLALALAFPCCARRRQAGMMKRGVAMATLFLAGPALAMGLFAGRNWVVSGEALALPWQGGFSLYEANRPGANGRYFAQRSFVQTSDRDANPARLLALEPFDEAPDTLRGDVDAHWKRRATEAIAEEPITWLGLMARKGLWLFTDREIYNIEDFGVHLEISNVLPWIPFTFGFVWPGALASLALAAVWPRGRRRLVGIVWVYAFFLGGAIALYFVSGRMRMPLLFPAAILAGAAFGVYACWDTKAMPPRRALGIQWLALALLALGLLWSWGDWGGVRSEDMRHAEYARLSNAAFMDRRPEMALDYAQRLARLRPDYPQAPQLRGQALYALGRADEAAVAFAEALKLLPNDPVAPYNLGVLSLERGETDGALAYFIESVRRSQAYPPAAARAALIHLQRRQVREAAALLQLHARMPNSQAPPELLVARILMGKLQRQEEDARQALDSLRTRFGEAGLKLLEDQLRAEPKPR